MLDDLGSFRLCLYRSGTEALASALLDAKVRHGSTKPNVIIPAYACPDLISASAFAGVNPVLVDTAPDAWGFDFAQLEAALTPDTIAIVAVNLLGLGDQSAELLAVARRHRTFLIQDSAQYLPAGSEVGSGAGNWRGDYIILSFGRGKPLNLLRGGALLIPSDQESRFLSAPTLYRPIDRLTEKVFSSRLAAIAFNLATHPALYGFTSQLPGLRLGATAFSVLKNRVKLPMTALKQLEAAYTDYIEIPTYSTRMWQPMLQSWSEMGASLLKASGCETSSENLLRLPLLLPTRLLRDQLFERMDRRGLGASVFYGASLDRVVGVPYEVREQGPFPEAQRLADRLLTLPTYNVGRDVIIQTDSAIRTVLGLKSLCS